MQISVLSVVALIATVTVLIAMPFVRRVKSIHSDSKATTISLSLSILFRSVQVKVI